MAVFSLVFMLLASVVYWENLFSLAPYLDAVPERVFKRLEIWRPITAMFVHEDSTHFLGNAISFTGLAFLLYGYFGRFLFPFAALVVGTVANIFSLMTYLAETRLLGMSGTIYVMAAAWLSLYFFIDRRFSISHRLLRTVGFTLIILIPSNISANVSYRTHAIGFLLGIALGSFYYRLKRDFIRSFDIYDYEEVEGLTH